MGRRLLAFRTVSFCVVLILFFGCLTAYAMPPWLQRGGSESEPLSMPDFQAEEEFERPYYYTQPERSKGPFLWVFFGFLATAFLTGL